MRHQDGFDVILKHDRHRFAELHNDGTRKHDATATTPQTKVFIHYSRHSRTSLECNLLPCFDFLSANAVKIRVTINAVEVKRVYLMNQDQSRRSVAAPLDLPGSFQSCLPEANNASIIVHIVRGNYNPRNPSGSAFIHLEGAGNATYSVEYKCRRRETESLGDISPPSKKADTSNAHVLTSASAGTKQPRQQKVSASGSSVSLENTNVSGSSAPARDMELDDTSNSKDLDAHSLDNLHQLISKLANAQQLEKGKKKRQKARESGAKHLYSLRKRLAENNQRLGTGTQPTGFKPLKPFEDKGAVHYSAIVQYSDAISKQIELHTLLVTTTDTHMAHKIRQESQMWNFNNIDIYQQQLDTCCEGFLNVRQATDGSSSTIVDRKKMTASQSVPIPNTPKKETDAQSIQTGTPLSTETAGNHTGFSASSQELTSAPLHRVSEQDVAAPPVNLKRKAAESVVSGLLVDGDDDEEISELKHRLLRSRIEQREAKAEKETLDLEMQLRARKKIKLERD